MFKTGIDGYDFGSAENRYVATFCSRYDTPIAEIITDIRGALRRGAYATFSIITPSTTVAIIIIIIDIYHGIAKSTIANIIKYAAIIKISP